MRRVFIFIILLLSLFFIYKCAVNPVTGKKELMLIPESSEINMGKKVDVGVKSQYGVYNNKTLNQYVNSIGKSIVPYTHRPKLKYYFTVLDTPVVNAFAAPGGYIYITRGLLALLNSEAELATVLGHELGHVNARHTAKAMTRNILFNVGLIVGSALSKDIRDVAPFVAIASKVLFLKYSRDNEYQADSLGIRYARLAGYNSGVMINFFKSLRKLEIKSGGGLPNFLSTHPLTVKRIERVKTYLKPTDIGLAIKKNRYLLNINNLIYGNNPRQGYVEKGMFYHPDLRFKFNIPFGWRISNTPKRVTIAPKNGRAAIILMAEQTNTNLNDYIRKLINNFTNPYIRSNGYTNVNNFNAYYVNFTVYNNNGNAQTSSETKLYLISIRKGGYIFSFIAAAKSQDFDFYKRYFANTIFSFSPLTNPYYINRQPTRVHIVKVLRTQTIKQFFLSKKLPRKFWEKTLLANNKTISSELKRGQLIKLLY